jgi:hypothetical protein
LSEASRCDVLDLFPAKAAAGREKDREVCVALFEYGYVTLTQVLEMVPTMPFDDKQQRTLRATIRRWAKAVREPAHNGRQACSQPCPISHEPDAQGYE